MATNGKRDTRLEARWRRLVEEHAGNGLTVREFCRLHKVTESSFYFWRRELDRRGRKRNKANPEQHKRPSTKATFVPVPLARRNRG